MSTFVGNTLVISSFFSSMSHPMNFRLFATVLALLGTLLTAPAQSVVSRSEFAAYQRDKRSLASNPTLKSIPGNILVRFKTNAPQSVVQQVLGLSKSSMVRSYSLIPGLAHVRTTQRSEQAIATLSANPWVELAEPDYVVQKLATPNDPYFGRQWGLHNIGQTVNSVAGTPDADIDMPEAWNVTTGNPSMVIAVIDTGTQWGHPDLAANIWTNTEEIPDNGIDDDGNGFVDDVRGWDFFDDDNNPDDEDGHGTHTAGTIAAEGNNGIGVTGVTWNCKIMPLRFIGPNGGSTSDAIAALNYAVAKGVKVSNNSWGGGGYSSLMYDAIRRAAAAGHIFVAAAGNSSQNTDSTPSYPASYNLDNILSVAATDNLDGLASFSNYGMTTVDLGAPGVNIASTYMGGGYAWLSGTSMAAPHVAGVVALVYQQNPGFTYTQVINRILSTPRPVPSLLNKTRTGGVLNAVAALDGNMPPTVQILSPSSGSNFTPGSTVTLSGSASDLKDGDLSSQISWTSSLNGFLGTGASLSTAQLSAGSHKITASVADSGSLAGSASVTITVGSIPNAPSNVVALNNKNATATVQWTDNSNNESGFQIWQQTKSKNGTWNGNTYYSVGQNITSAIVRSGTGTFRYSVRARNTTGDSSWSAWSAEVTVTRR